MKTGYSKAKERIKIVEEKKSEGQLLTSKEEKQYKNDLYLVDLMARKNSTMKLMIPLLISAGISAFFRFQIQNNVVRIVLVVMLMIVSFLIIKKSENEKYKYSWVYFAMLPLMTLGLYIPLFSDVISKVILICMIMYCIYFGGYVLPDNDDSEKKDSDDQANVWCGAKQTLNNELEKNISIMDYTFV